MGQAAPTNHRAGACLRFQEVDIAHESPAAHQLDLRRGSGRTGKWQRSAPRPALGLPRGPAGQACGAGGPRLLAAPCGCAAGRPARPPRTRCAEKDWRLLFQKASTKILLYLMAMGHTVASAAGRSMMRVGGAGRGAAWHEHASAPVRHLRPPSPRHCRHARHANVRARRGAGRASRCNRRRRPRAARVGNPGQPCGWAAGAGAHPGRRRRA